MPDFSVEQIDKIPSLVQRLYGLVDELQTLFPERKFTPDGHLVGSLGEVLASHYYELTLLPCSTECHDAIAADGRQVQIKATQGSSVGLRAEPEHLLVISLLRDGTIAEAYNGPGKEPWDSAGAMQKNGQCSISLSRLRKIMLHVPDGARLPRPNNQI